MSKATFSIRRTVLAGLMLLGGVASLGAALQEPVGSRGDECTPASQTADPPACDTPALGCNLLYPICPDGCSDADWVSGKCTGPAGDCKSMATQKDSEICNDCRCSDLLGGGICVSTGNYTSGPDETVMDCQ
ncbi:MAG: hypothetical protein AAF682_20550 [Planctomycetota bacterium]